MIRMFSLQPAKNTEVWLTTSHNDHIGLVRQFHFFFAILVIGDVLCLENALKLAKAAWLFKASHLTNQPENQRI